MANTNKPAVEGTQGALDKLKYEIASELGVQLGADRTARENGSVGGMMTKRLIEFAEQNLK